MDSMKSFIFGCVTGAMTTQPTTVSNQNGVEWTANDRPEKINGIADMTLSNMSSTALLYDIFKNSVNTGILRRNTIFPSESINGFIYFPLPFGESFDMNQDVVPFEPSEYNYELYIMTQYGDKTIKFKPIEGE
ncbi:MAG: hypothetical protein WC602_03105 [archaeon]